jgi:sugar phosphate isomerase/epimerase
VQLIGHTMATPGKSAEEAIALFADCGFAGAELVCREGMALPPDTPLDTARQIADHARRLNCPVVTVTPYAWEINSADPGVAKEHRQLFRRACDLAAAMGARFVRAYGGKEVTGDGAPAAWTRTVEALRELAPYAAERQLTILVENHPGTMTRTGTATRQLLDEVARPNIRALYDPANVLDDTDEPWETTFSVQAGAIGYVHVKDFAVEDGKRQACCVGAGVVPWDQILPRLVASGFDGCLSFEYEKMWYPEQLPEPETGLRRCADFVQRQLA